MAVRRWRCPWAESPHFCPKTWALDEWRRRIWTPASRHGTRISVGDATPARTLSENRSSGIRMSRQESDWTVCPIAPNSMPAPIWQSLQVQFMDGVSGSAGQRMAKAKRRMHNASPHVPATYFIRSMGLSLSAASCNRRAYSMYSVIRCRKLNGSLKTTGIVILLNSLPMQFFKTDQRLNSNLVNWGAGSVTLKEWNANDNITEWAGDQWMANAKCVQVYEMNIWMLLCSLQQ